MNIKNALANSFNKKYELDRPDEQVLTIAALSMIAVYGIKKLVVAYWPSPEEVDEDDDEQETI